MSQRPRCKQRDIKFVALQSSGVFDPHGSHQMCMQACPLGPRIVWVYIVTDSLFTRPLFCSVAVSDRVQKHMNNFLISDSFSISSSYEMDKQSPLAAVWMHSLIPLKETNGGFPLVSPCYQFIL